MRRKKRHSLIYVLIDSLTTVFRIDSAGTEGECRSRKARRRRLEQYHKYTRTAPQTKVVIVAMAHRSRILGIF